MPIFHPRSKIARVWASSTQATLTGSTSETILATITIPGGLIRAGDMLRIMYQGTHNNSVGTKTHRIRFGGIGGSAYLATAPTTSITITDDRRISFPTTSSQKGHSAASVYGASSSGTVTGAVDTSSNVDLVFTGQLSDGADNMALESYVVELIRS